MRHVRHHTCKWTIHNHICESKCIMLDVVVCAQFIDDSFSDDVEFEFGVSNPGSTYSDYDVDFIDFVDDCDDL